MKMILATIGFLAVLAFAGCAALMVGAAGAASGPVTYRVEVDGGTGSVTYEGPSGQEQHNGVAFPWSATVEDVALPVLLAQKDTDGPGEIRCVIERDGEVIAESTSSGPYATCTASAV